MSTLEGNQTTSAHTVSLTISTGLGNYNQPYATTSRAETTTVVGGVTYATSSSAANVNLTYSNTTTSVTASWFTTSAHASLGLARTTLVTTSSNWFPAVLTTQIAGPSSRAGTVTTTRTRTASLLTTRSRTGTNTRSTFIVSATYTTTDTSSMTLSNYTLGYTHVIPGNNYVTDAYPNYATVYRANYGEVIPISSTPATIGTLEPQMILALATTLKNKYPTYRFSYTDLSRVPTTITYAAPTQYAATTAVRSHSSISVVFPLDVFQTGTGRMSTTTSATTHDQTTTRAGEIIGEISTRTVKLFWTTTAAQSYFANQDGRPTIETYAGSTATSSLFTWTERMEGEIVETSSMTKEITRRYFRGLADPVGAVTYNDAQYPLFLEGQIRSPLDMKGTGFMRQPATTGGGYLPWGPDRIPALIPMSKRTWTHTRTLTATEFSGQRTVTASNFQSWDGTGRSISTTQYFSYVYTTTNHTVSRVTLTVNTSQTGTFEFAEATNGAYLTTAALANVVTYGPASTILGGHGEALYRTTLISFAGSRRITLLDASGGSTTTITAGTYALAASHLAHEAVTHIGDTFQSSNPKGPAYAITFKTS